MEKRTTAVMLILLMIFLGTACIGTPEAGTMGNDVVRETEQRVLLIIQETDETDFKQVLADETQKRLNEQGISSDMVRVKNPARVKNSGYDVVVIVWRITFGEMPTKVERYMDKMEGKERLILFATNGGGELLSDYGVDTISCASQNVDQIDPALEAEELTEWILAKLAAK